MKSITRNRITKELDETTRLSVQIEAARDFLRTANAHGVVDRSLNHLMTKVELLVGLQPYYAEQGLEFPWMQLDHWLKDMRNVLALRIESVTKVHRSVYAVGDLTERAIALVIERATPFVNEAHSMDTHHKQHARALQVAIDAFKKLRADTPDIAQEVAA